MRPEVDAGVFHPVVRQESQRRTLWRKAVLSGAAAFAVLGVVTLLSNKLGNSRNELLFRSPAIPWSDVPEVIRPDDAAKSAQEMAQPYSQSHKHVEVKMAFNPTQSSQQSSTTGVFAPLTFPSQAPVASKSPHSIAWPKSPPTTESTTVSSTGTQVQQTQNSFLAMPFDGKFSQQDTLPRPEVGNGLALGYYTLSNLPASTAVQFAKRETNFASGALNSNPSAPTSIDQNAALAYRQGTQVVIDRRQKDGILPRPLTATDEKLAPPAANQGANQGANQMKMAHSHDMQRELAVAQEQVQNLEARVLRLESERQQPGP